MFRQCQRCLAVAHKPTPLGAVLRRRIESSQGKGLSFADFMDAAMRDPDLGYFTTKAKVIGSDADFITAPELLPEFGWSYANWFVQAARKSGWTEGQPISLVEAGPGTGRLMAHLLMFLKYEAPEMLPSLNVSMVEVSPVMIAQQEQQLAPYAPHLASLTWAPTLQKCLATADYIPEGSAAFVVSNEYLDVLPVHIFVRRHPEGNAGTPLEWVEERVGISEDDPERFCLKPGSSSDSSDVRRYISKEVTEGAEEGTRIEVCPQAVDDMVLIGERVEATGGMALAVDYGKDIPSHNTLQGMHRQETCPPLLNPGEIDISWHVDFSCIREHVGKACPSLLVTSAQPQASFLNAMGFSAMVQNRVANAGASPLPAHFEERVRLLLDPSQMGGHHRAVAICSKELYPPPGF
eukprot:TRINITY_DN33573_c0_g1_i1.p1 TRINITY_DN33573_c0_g1~~TRINITY_DN33573_c0_g1_i1.p1  ORF type:complete len:407 (+),score=123.72 TRINITY_DN33573_c0_g1_i1:34-1254(+)